jgi:uncharacterized protein
MELFCIPIQDKFIIYRPLSRLAFIGNRPMAELAMDIAAEVSNPMRDLPVDVLTYLRTIGFIQPDPEPPSRPDHAFRPTVAVLLLTNRCNLRCTYCYASGGDAPAQDLSIDLARVAIDHVYENAKKLGRPQFGLTFHGGGEPMQLWRTVQQATDYARSKDLPCQISMVTNGVWSAHQTDALAGPIAPGCTLYL